MATLGLGAIGQYPLGGGPTGTVSVTTIGWFAPLSEPVRFKQAKQATIALNEQYFTFNPNPVVSFSWYRNLNEPVRYRYFRPSLQQTLAYQPAPIISIGWYNWLSEPKRFKRGLAPPQQPYFSFQPTPIIDVSWYNSLSEPRRFKRGLAAQLQQFTTQDTKFIPTPSTFLNGWFNWLSEPKRFPKGLRVQYQRDLGMPPRALPTPNITVTIAATEVNTDSALLAVNVIKFPTPATAKVSLTEIGGGSATSIIESS